MKHGPEDPCRLDEKPDSANPQEDEADPETSGDRNQSSPPAPGKSARVKKIPDGGDPSGLEADEDAEGDPHQTGGFFF